MDILFLSLRVLLAGVMAVAGIAKLADLAGSRQAMRDFGLPANLAAPAGLLLPLAEIAVALALLPARTAWLGAGAAFVLLLIFTGGIAVNLARGRTPNCHCFGQLHSQPIGSATLIRNGALLLLAGLIVLQGPTRVGPGLVAWLTSLSPMGLFILLGTVVVVALFAFQSWVVLNLLRQNGRLMLRVEALENHLGLATQPADSNAQTRSTPKGLPVGTPAPYFELPALNGTQQSLAKLLEARKPLLLLFSSTSCAPCLDLMGEVAEWQQQYRQQLTIVVINRGSADEARAKAGSIDPATFLLQAEGEIAALYEISGTPSALLVSVDGRIRTSRADGATAIRELVKTASQPLSRLAESLLPRAPIALEMPARRPSTTPKQQLSLLKLGEPAPRFQLPDLDNKQTGIADLRGQSTLLLFWNPACGFCRRMLSDLQAWEAAPPADAPRLVLISTGSVEANRVQGLAAPILIDEGFATGHAYGAKGTPSAILLDAQGNVASPLVVGASNIMPYLTTQAAAPNLVAQRAAA